MKTRKGNISIAKHILHENIANMQLTNTNIRINSKVTQPWLKSICFENRFSALPANVSLDGSKGECMDGKFQKFTFGPENNNRSITYIVVDSSGQESKVLVKNLPSQRISIPIGDTNYCVSI